MIKCLKMYMKKSFDNIEVTQCESFRVHNENKQFNRYIKSADKHFESLESRNWFNLKNFNYS